MDWQAMARVAWSRKSRLASWTGLGLGLVDSTRRVLGKVIKPFRCCQRQTENCQPQNNADLQNLSHARADSGLLSFSFARVGMSR